MNHSATTLISLLVTIAVMITVTTIVSIIVHRSSETSTRKATRPDVLFIVSMRRWAYLLVRIVGIVIAAVGCLLLLVALFGGQDSTLGMGIAGTIIIIGGLLFVWLAQAMTRIRLEVTSDTIWNFTWFKVPRKVSLKTITALKPLLSNNYGGIVAVSGSKHLFYASRVMLGYSQLIEYFQTSRPDLEIPEGSLPL